MSTKKIGVFGGTFNPIHYGHINSIKSVLAKLELDEIKVVPASQSPLRMNIQGPSPEQRFSMVESAISSEFKKNVSVNDLEIKRGGLSYSIDTLKALIEAQSGEYHLIVGLDQFENFDRWQDFSGILSVANLVVTSRPGSIFPTEVDQFPKGLISYVENLKGNTASLTTGKTIYFLQLEDLDVSGTELRKKLRSGLELDGEIPPSAMEFIRSHSLYEALEKKISDYRAFTEFCAGVLHEKNGININAYDLTELSAPSEFTVVCSGTSSRHAQALSEKLVRQVKKSYGVFPQNVEGQKEGRWIVLDYGSLIIHVFYDYVRMEYRIEDLWAQGKYMTLRNLTHPIKKD